MAAAPRVYVSFPGTARTALTFYAETFGGELRLYSYADFGRDDGPPDAIAHGELDGLVSLGGSDAAPGEVPARVERASTGCCQISRRHEQSVMAVNLVAALGRR